MWRSEARVQSPEPLEEDAVLGHGVVNTGRREQSQVEKAERGDGDGRRDPAVRAGSEDPPHGIGGGCRGCRQAVAGQGRQIHEVHQQIHDDDEQRPGHQCPRKRAPGVADLLGHAVGVLPPSVREQDRHERGREREQRQRRTRRRGCGRRDLGKRAGDPEAPENQHAEGSDLQDHEDVQEAAAGLDAHVVHQGHENDRQDGQRLGVAGSGSEKPQQVLRERYAHGRDPAALDHHERGPAEEKSDEGVIGVPKVDVLAAGLGKERRELGEREGSRHGDQAARDPGGEDPAGRRQALGHQIRVDEDSGADDAADDDHGGVEGSESAAQAHWGGAPRVAAPSCERTCRISVPRYLPRASKSKATRA